MNKKKNNVMNVMDFRYKYLSIILRNRLNSSNFTYLDECTNDYILNIELLFLKICNYFMQSTAYVKILKFHVSFLENQFF